ncbi:DUF397 domain-containing protein [Streptomyces sp. WAC 06783]|uniref:DUF397 domain-containing protein n=1 Tax=Streptomyces sp. WAC 06783 TaxID=2203211 RepID=UPI000F73FD0B|nr:DUF397 domain-containing protein [Streptomyces sp. WAC 06783]RSO06916.1 DUF397 domain-containing protein [Streptomyces sp. WAC 06783]
MRFDNGFPADTIPDAAWVKSRASVRDGNCVELTPLPQGGVAVRNSRHPGGPALVYTRQEMSAFMEGVKASEFDHLIGS